MRVAGLHTRGTRLPCNIILPHTIRMDRSGLATTHLGLARSMQEGCHLDYPALVVSTWLERLALVDQRIVLGLKENEKLHCSNNRSL
jgi:hypothetical protein